ncbi:hypothetical protein HOA55_00385 [archaeon]|nr:hypothetical protein [archaeon]MBT3578286.1 hypothetical protein [archaeon]MBT6819793.1 hypothetical protein [archaeon]MBT7025575.1 hypothetical protein [archaeon]MBT7239083.1 hypothetical protein [archaeon]
MFNNTSLESSFEEFFMIIKFLFSMDKFNIGEGKDKILVSYPMAREDHHNLVMKSIEKFPKKEIVLLDNYYWKKRKSILKYKFRFPDIALLFKIWRKFKKEGAKKVFGKHFLYFLTRTYFRCKQIESLEEIYSRLKPRAHIAFCSQTFAEDTILALLSQKDGKPTFTLQHGLIVEYPYFTSQSILQENLVSDYSLVWGKKTAEVLEKYTDSSKIIVVGNPKYNIMEENKTNKFNPTTGTIFLPVIGTSSPSKKMLAILNNFAKNHPEIKFNLSLHPFDDIKNYSEIITATNLKYCPVKNVSETIKNSDFIVIHNTTIAIESLQYGKPIFRYSDDFLVKLWKNDDCFKSEKDLEKLFRKLNNPKKYLSWSKKYQKEFRENFYQPKEGTVSENYYKKVLEKIKDF